jgi:SAM-dependent methyltransferase
MNCCKKLRVKTMIGLESPSLEAGHTWLSGFFKVPLRELSEQAGPALRGIYTPEPEIGAEKIGISDQFLANAEAYHERYSGSEHMEAVLRHAFRVAGVRENSSPMVLDIGTGSGTNSLLPMLSIFDRPKFVATDLSPDLLVILRRLIEREDLGDQIACVCTNAMNSFFSPGQFDIVSGVSLLHHLIDPSLALTAAYDALREGGVAVFCDPFEGYGIIGVAFNLILERAERDGNALAPEVGAFLRAMVQDFDARRGTDKSHERFRYMDDKWLFTRKYFEDAANNIGFRRMTIVPNLTASHETYFRAYAEVLLKLGCGLGPDALPGWAWETIDMFDRSFSPEMKADLVMDGTVILRK